MSADKTCCTGDEDVSAILAFIVPSGMLSSYENCRELIALVESERRVQKQDHERTMLKYFNWNNCAP